MGMAEFMDKKREEMPTQCLHRDRDWCLCGGWACTDCEQEKHSPYCRGIDPEYQGVERWPE